jgi:hypothetical protein
MVQRHAVLGIHIEERRRHGCQAQPLLHHCDRDEKYRGDFLLALAFLPQGEERTKLVKRVQRGPLHVLRQAVLLGDALGAHDARDWRVLCQPPLLDQKFQRPKAAPTGGDFIHAGLGTVCVQHWANGQTLQQRAPRDIRGEFFDRNTGFDVPDIGL